MHQDKSYVTDSLELHLFFARIMKEHSLFLKAGFTPADPAFAKEAEFFKREFEDVLNQAVGLSDGVVGGKVLGSGEICTEFTAKAEEQTEKFTGIVINKAITARQARLRCFSGGPVCPNKTRQVKALNGKALRLLDGLIALKERILNGVTGCRMFTGNYPLLLEHILREARLYRDFVRRLERQGSLDCQTMAQAEQFWNRIMMEHAMFIRGLLDPSENELIDTADGFARDFARLLAQSRSTQDRAIRKDSSLQKTVQLRDFKAAGAKGIQECRVRSVILPLLADHVLREANHYIRLLSQ